MFSQKKPYSAVTVTVERLTGEAYEEDDLSGIPDLVEVIKLQATGPTEAARALRKKLKYGSTHRQIRSLILLDGLIENAGPRFQRTFVDEPLLERLRVCGTSDLSDPDVKKKCSELFRSWAVEYKNTPGLERIASLYKELPRRKQVVTQDRSRVLRETENPFDADEEEERAKASPSPAPTPPPIHATSSRSPPPPAQPVAVELSSSKDKKRKDKEKEKEKKGKGKPFNLEAEKEKMKTTIAESSMSATDLLNALQTINRERERISENKQAVQRFEACKLLRRKILRYIYHVESEQWLGALLHANDELVTALMTFEQLDRSVDIDSDSEDDLIAEQAHIYRMATMNKDRDHAAGDLAGLSLEDTGPAPAKPPRPAAPPRPPATSKPLATRPPVPIPAPEEEDAEDEDENDPFADRNAVQTPAAERREPQW